MRIILLISLAMFWPVLFEAYGRGRLWPEPYGLDRELSQRASDDPEWAYPDDDTHLVPQ